MNDPKNGGAAPGAAPGAPTSQRTSNEIPASQAKPREVESVKLPTLELPKGGGAIRGIGEKVSTNVAMGTAGVSVPIKTSPGRGGFGPQLGLSYSSGAGNGLFGLGWGLGVPSVSRRTDKRIPSYDEEDTFLYGDEEELVPQLAGGAPVAYEDALDGLDEADLLVDCERFLPRVEGAHARIERITESDGNVFWRVTTPDNTTHIFGRSADARVVDPDQPTRVYRWLLERTYDDRGNVAQYEYKQEDLVGVDPLAVYERNRWAGTCGQLHPKRIYYGNRAAYDLAHAPMAHDEDDFLFVVAFDYGEHVTSALFEDRPTGAVPHPPAWAHRQDAFSTHRQGFELRTRRLCQRVLMFHRFDVEAPDLVAVTCFHYDPSPAATLLRRTWIEGHGNDDTVGLSVLASPPLDFDYGPATLDEHLGAVAPEDLAGLPEGLDGQRYRWVDLDLEGLPGVLTEQGGHWFYKRNQGDGHFGATKALDTLPNLATLRGGAALTDLGGDGGLQLVAAAPAQGFFERGADGSWESFRTFQRPLNVPLSDPNVKLLDLDGDGMADVLVSEDDVFCWYPSQGRVGYAPGRRQVMALDDEKGPRLVFADPEQSIFLADMSGDGLTDLVRIRNGSICYWPNLGYGRFGAKVTMAGSPVFDREESFRRDRVQLSDVDGTGTTDVMYLGPTETRLWRNQSGNRFGAAELLYGVPPVSNVGSVHVVDLLGKGTTCVVWSSPLPGDATAPLRYDDLFQGRKPYLLEATRNNLGAETVFEYESSTRHYLDDRAAGRPWVTKLPFPVQVVAKVRTRDLVTGSEHVASYRYHHGYYDRTEKEFRGFGMVEQTDAESFAPYVGSGVFGESPTDVMNVPPVVTKTWSHTGAWFEGQRIEEHFRAHEYYRGAAASFRGEDHVLNARLPITVLPEGLPPSAQREACRALRGRTLRTEVYANDGTASAGIPYQIAEANFRVAVVQEKGRHAVVRVDPGESISFQTERDDADPRVAHTLTLAVDDYGTVTKSIAVVYPRRVSFTKPEGMSDEIQDVIRAAQSQLYITYSETDVAHAAAALGPYRLGVPLAARSYEVLWRTVESDPAPDTPTVPPEDRFFRVDDFESLLLLTSADDVVAPAAPASLSSAASPQFQRRLLEASRAFYWNDDLDAALAHGAFGARALPFETRVAAFTNAHLDAIYGARIPSTSATTDTRSELLTTLGAYLHEDAFWWARGGGARPSATHFYQPTEFYDAWHMDAVGGTSTPKSTVTYDDYALFAEETADVLGNVSLVEMDYHLLQPSQVTDPNGNVSLVRYDALGRVVETYALGKGGAEGDRLASTGVTALPGAIFEYSLNSATPVTFSPTTPVSARAVVRTQHRGESFEEARAYSDGFGRELLTKTKVEPATEGGAARWIGSGRTVFNNKGNAVKKYEPYFSTTDAYESEASVVATGVTPVLHYDALGRLMETELPDGTRTRVVFSAWHEEHWDPNDTVEGNAWAAACEAMPATDPRKAAQMAALAQALTHRDTPTKVYLDTLARPVVSTADNTLYGEDKTLYPTRVALDVQGRQSEVIDALGRRVQWQGFDLLGRALWTRMMDASGGLEPTTGATIPDALETAVVRMLPDVAGQSLRKWSERGYEFRHDYDVARRPIAVWMRRRDDPDLTGSTVITPEQTPVMTEHFRYGEELTTTAATFNLRGRLWRSYDGAGLVQHIQHDLHGNLTAASRRLLQGHRDAVDWAVVAAAAVGTGLDAADDLALSAEAFESSSIFDALGRVVDMVPPHSTDMAAPATHARLVRQTYNQAGLLATVEARFGTDTSDFTPLLVGVTYNARRQREQVVHGNGITTDYTYDDRSFRLTRLLATRGTGGALKTAQDLGYTYDAAGNVVAIEDAAGAAAQPLVEALTSASTSAYTYDSLYRLVTATGREHPATVGDSESELEAESGRFAHANDLTGLRGYTESYDYDAVGNLLAVTHGVPSDTTQSWVRDYRYAAGDNRLMSTRLPADLSTVPTASLPERYAYDAHGNMTAMPHLPTMAWDAYEQLSAASNAGGAGRVECHFQYDAQGQRVRKAVEHYAADACTIVEERIYFGGFEVYRRHTGSSVAAAVDKEVQSLHLMDGEQRIALHDTRTKQPSTGGSVETPAVGARVTRLRYQHGNHLGSACLETDEAGALVSYEEYHPYGTTAILYTRDGDGDEPKRYRFTGMERDETGLQYHSARYYAPWLGRWTSPDPSGLVDGTNEYQYCDSNPVVTVDTSGRWGIRDALRAVGNHAIMQAGQTAGLALHAVGAVVGTALTVAALATPVLGRRVAERIGNQIVSDSRAAYRREGGGVDGALAVVNQFNPVYHALVEGHAAQRELDAGHHFQAGLHQGRAVGQAIDAVMMATGAAPVINRGLGAARRAISGTARGAGRELSGGIERLLRGAPEGPAAASVGSGGITSQPVTREGILRALRQQGSPEAHATATAIRRGAVDLQIRPISPDGRYGEHPLGTNIVRVFADANPRGAIQAAGTAAHELTHVLQRLTSSSYHRGHEFEAFMRQARVDSGFQSALHSTYPGHSSLADVIWTHIKSHPVYAKVPNPPGVP